MSTNTISQTGITKGNILFSNKNQSAVTVIDFKQPLEVIYDHPIPQLKDNEILVHNKAIGLNPIDWKGKKFGFGIYHFPWVNGRESSGIIVKKGSTVQNLEVGDKVIVSSTSYRDNRTSTFQEYTAIDSRLVWKLPHSFSFEDGATIGVGLVTAGVLFYDSFDFDFINKSVGDNGTLLLWGGATVVGLYITQLAKLNGLKVISVASLENEQYIRNFGADIVIERYLDRSEVVKRVLEKGGGRINYGIDCVSRETSAIVVEILSRSSIANPDIKPLFSGIVSAPKEIPDNVSRREVVIKKFHDDPQFGKSLIETTSRYLENGEIQPVRYRSYNGGIQKIGDALRDLEVLGAKAEKFVVSVEA